MHPKTSQLKFKKDSPKEAKSKVVEKVEKKEPEKEKLSLEGEET